MNWHFGVLAGYVGVNINTPQDMNIPGQSGNVDAPSVGLYSAFSKGNFSADVQARLYNLQAESLGQRLDGRGYSLTANMGYRFDLPGNWTLEPSVGGVFSHTSIDPLTIAGVPFPVGPTAFVPLSGALQFQDVDSALGRASMTLGTSLPLFGGQIVAYPFVTGSVFHEFEGNVTASIAINTTLPIQGSGSLTASSIGTYAQFGGGSAFELPNTGWLGFARVDYRTGENIQGYSVIAGLRYQFEAENRARHPEMAVKARPAEGYDWTGPYVGVSAGSTWGSMHRASQGGTVDPDYAGYLFGGQAGYNYQTGQFVWGIEADAGASNARGGAPVRIHLGPGAVLRQRRLGIRRGHGRDEFELCRSVPWLAPCSWGDEINQLGERLDRRRRHRIRPHGQVVREGRIHALWVPSVRFHSGSKHDS
jgi:hypothetical protein